MIAEVRDDRQMEPNPYLAVCGMLTDRAGLTQEQADAVIDILDELRLQRPDVWSLNLAPFRPQA